MAFQDEVRTLIRLGLTGNQAKVYLALVRCGTCTVKRISEASGVPRQEIYRNLDELSKLGFVNKIVDRPTKFNPMPIEDSISNLLERKTNEFSELHKESARLLKNFKEDESEQAEQKAHPEFIIFNTQKQIRKKGIEALNKVQKVFV